MLTDNEIDKKVEVYRQSLEELTERVANLHDWRMEKAINKEVDELLYNFLNDNKFI